MILILGGTTEGRIAVRTLDQAAKPYYYSTLEQQQEISCAHGTRLTGALDSAGMQAFCQEHCIRLLVDAAHPFAVGLHQNIAACAQALQLPVIRLERTFRQHPEVHWCKDYTDAVSQLEQDSIHRLLALTGVKTIGKLKGYWERHDCLFRVLNRPESIALAEAQGFPAEKLAFYDLTQEDQTEANRMLMKSYRPDAIITKESGVSGGFEEKLEVARELHIPVYAVKRPELPSWFLRVSGEYSLRREIERLVPGFYDQRIGFTTGTCATAAAKAALQLLLNDTAPEQVVVKLPNGEEICLEVAEAKFTANGAWASVIKDAGDDPDITNGSTICATIERTPKAGIHFLQGEGVGRVTLPGLGIPVGDPAINKTPRAMMTQELTTLLLENGLSGGLNVTISVPGGAELAKRTFNPKLGIEGGISIIGTLGVVRPFSTEAFIESIHREVEVCVALGNKHLVINSGAKSERYLKARFPELPAQAFVHYGNFIGETLKIAHELKLEQVTMGIMLGKAVKLAEGNLNTHSKTVIMNKTFLETLAEEAHCNASVTNAIEELTLARELWEHLDKASSQAFFPKILEKCMDFCKPLVPDAQLTIMLIDEKGNIPYQITG